MKLLLVCLLLLNAYATFRTLRAVSFSAGERLRALLLIWLVPVIGAVFAIAYTNTSSGHDEATSTFDPERHGYDYSESHSHDDGCSGDVGGSGD